MVDLMKPEELQLVSMTVISDKHLQDINPLLKPVIQLYDF